VAHSCEFLLTSLQPKLQGEDLSDHEDYGQATKIAEKVGCLPLAISMIVGYVRVSRCTLDDFLEMWEEKECRKKNRKKKTATEDAGVDATIDSLWEIGIREVQMNCRRLLDILSFFDAECTPKALLVGDHKEDYLEFLNSSETIRYEAPPVRRDVGARLTTCPPATSE